MECVGRLSLLVLAILTGACAGDGTAPGSDVSAEDPPSLVLWFEQPTIGYAPDFFATQYRALTDYLNGTSQTQIATHRVVVRIEDPAVTWAGGQQPWRVAPDADFVADLVGRLPADYELFVLPSDDTWTFAPDIGDPIGKQMFWVSRINAVIPEGKPKIAGFVLDPDGSTAAEKVALIDEMNAQRALYLPPSVRIGMTFGTDEFHKSLAYLAAGAAHPLDEVYVEAYNIYTSTEPPQYDAQTGSTTTIYTENRNEPSGIFSAFSGLLAAPPNLWRNVSLDAATAARVVLLFSVENIDNGKCIAPDTKDGKCGQIDAFGTWTLATFIDFLDTFGEREGELFPPGSALVPPRNFGIFQYNFLPAPGS